MDSDEENPTNCVGGGKYKLVGNRLTPFTNKKKELVNAPNRIQLASICQTWVKQTLEKN
jgi:hypothetical protein